MEWIPIDKDWPGRGELPNDDTNVLISIGDEVFEAYREGDFWWIANTEIDFHIDAVDAWMPKPKPYERR